MLEFSDASERNKGPILAVLTEALANSRRVLEVGSGTGQHAVHFGRHLAHVAWQPSELPSALPALRARISAEAPDNVGEPLELDVTDEPWPRAVVDGEFDAVFTANTLHIMSWTSVESFFDGLDLVLTGGGVLCIYGPFRYRRAFTTPSNERFDRMLKERDPLSGIRDFEAVNALARDQGLELIADHAMPANNQLLVWRRLTTRTKRTGLRVVAPD
jgi:SAM-dependent methyltransferase